MPFLAANLFVKTPAQPGNAPAGAQPASGLGPHPSATVPPQQLKPPMTAAVLQQNHAAWSLARAASNSCLFDCETSDEPSTHQETDNTNDSTHKRRALAKVKRRNSCAQTPHDAIKQISAILAPSSYYGHQVRKHCDEAAGSLRTESGTIDVVKMGQNLQQLGYRVIVRRALNCKQYWTKSLTSKFLVLRPKNGDLSDETIVDPNFKELFRVAFMTSGYKDLLDGVPEMFIGTTHHLKPVIQILCEEVELSFLEAGRPVPPWRSSSVVLNRWISDSYADTDLATMELQRSLATTSNSSTEGASTCVVVCRRRSPASSDDASAVAPSAFAAAELQSKPVGFESAGFDPAGLQSKSSSGNGFNSVGMPAKTMNGFDPAGLQSKSSAGGFDPSAMQPKPIANGFDSSGLQLHPGGNGFDSASNGVGPSAVGPSHALGIVPGASAIGSQFHFITDDAPPELKQFAAFVADINRQSGMPPAMAPGPAALNTTPAGAGAAAAAHRAAGMPGAVGLNQDMVTLGSSSGDVSVRQGKLFRPAALGAQGGSDQALSSHGSQHSSNSSSPPEPSGSTPLVPPSSAPTIKVRQRSLLSAKLAAAVLVD